MTCLSPFVVANAQGEFVAGNELVACLLYAPRETLKAFQSVERHAMWTGYERRWTGAEWIVGPASPGAYRVYGRVDGRLL